MGGAGGAVSGSSVGPHRLDSHGPSRVSCSQRCESRVAGSGFFKVRFFWPFCILTNPSFWEVAFLAFFFFIFRRICRFSAEFRENFGHPSSTHSKFSPAPRTDRHHQLHIIGLHKCVLPGNEGKEVEIEIFIRSGVFSDVQRSDRDLVLTLVCNAIKEYQDDSKPISNHGNHSALTAPDCPKCETPLKWRSLQSIKRLILLEIC